MSKRTFSAISYEVQRLGEVFKALRLERGLSIRGVAYEIGIAPSYLAKIEAGNTFKTIGVETLVRLCKFFRTPCNVVLEKANYIQMPEDGLPEFGDYLQLKYQLPKAAVQEIELMLAFTKEKYRQPIQVQPQEALLPS